MKKNYLIFTFILACIFQASGQNTSNKTSEISLKVKPVKSILNYKFCDSADYKMDAIVLEFDVINEKDKTLYGNKIYAIAICDEIPSEGTYNSKEIYDLTISEEKYFPWEIKIFNETLLNENVNMKKFWLIELSKKVEINCKIRK